MKEDVDDLLDGVEPLQGHDHYRHRTGDAETGEKRLDGGAHDLAQDDAGRLVEPEDEAAAGDAGLAVEGRCRWHHRLRRGQVGGPAHRPEAAGEGGDEADDGADGEDPGIGAEDQQWKAVELGVDLGIDPAQPGPGRPAQDNADPGHGHHQLGIVPAHLPVAVAEGLHQADLAAIGGDQAAQHHVAEEGGHRQEDGRQDGRHGLLHVDLVHQEPVGDLLGPGDGAGAAVAFQQLVEAFDHILRIGAVEQTQAEIVEGAVEIVGRLQRLAADPHDAEAVVVGHQGAGSDGVDILRREGDADHGEGAQVAVHQCLEAVAGLHAVGVGEGLAQHHLIRMAGAYQAAFPQHQLIEARLSALRDGDQLADHRLLEALDGESGEILDPMVDGAHPGDGADLLDQPLRRPLDAGEDLAEALPLVVGFGGLGQGLQGGEGHHQHRHPGGDDDRDGQHLPPQLPEIANQLFVQRAHRIPPRGAACRTRNLCALVNKPITSSTPPPPVGMRCARCSPHVRHQSGSPGRPFPRLPCCG